MIDNVDYIVVALFGNVVNDWETIRLTTIESRERAYIFDKV